MFARKERREAKELAVNISSLMDILTILLLFLILSFDSQEANVKPPKNIELAASSSELQVKLAVKLTVSQEDIQVEEQVVCKLAPGGVFKKSDLDKSNLVKPLLKELQRQKARLQSGSTATGEEDESEIVYFEVGKGIRYDLVDRVLKTAATAGFTKFRLAVHRAG